MTTSTPRYSRMAKSSRREMQWLRKNEYRRGAQSYWAWSAPPSPRSILRAVERLGFIESALLIEQFSELGGGITGAQAALARIPFRGFIESTFPFEQDTETEGGSVYRSQ